MPASERADGRAAPLRSGAEVLRDLDSGLRERLAWARRAGEETATRVAWVGGGVRDALAGGHPPGDDVDLVVEGDLERFADRLAALAGAKRGAASAFRTLALAMPEGARIDLSEARRERYPAPGALPEVEPADLESDLLRRDFTVNSMAIVLTSGPWGESGALVDPSGGRADLAARLLRVHHGRSFLDDPTRIYRGVDFEARFGHRLEPETGRLAAAALASGAVGRISGARLRNALVRAFGRPRTAVSAWSRAGELGAVATIAPGLLWSERGRRAIASAAAGFASTAADAASPELLLLGLGALLAERPATEREGVAIRLELDARGRAFLVEGIERVAAAAELSPEALPGAAHRRLARLSELELMLLGSYGGAAERWARREREELRPLRLEIDGRSLLAHGIAAGPAIGEALARTLEARLDGRIEARDELDYALAAARGAGR